jgi:tetratricopeptide (TPR) repeat protein
LLVERAEGNPLFMEELLRLLVDDRIILVEGEQWHVEESRLAHVRVPPSLMGVLQTRLDTLLYAEKLTLQRAAVFGRVFHDTLLQTVDAVDDAHVAELPGALATLEARGFIQRRETSSFAGSVEYAFAQGMLREMLYVTLLECQRQTYHAAAAAWLAQTERAEEYLPLIAEHYGKAGDHARAAEYLERAGDQAMRLSSFADAARFYDRLLAPATALHVKRAEAYYRLSDFPAARAAIEQAQAAATTATDRASALALLGEMTSWLGDQVGAQAILAEALPLARAGGDRLTLCRVLYALGSGEAALGNVDDARTALNESLALARELGDLNRELFALNRLGTAAIQQDIAEAERLLSEVHARAVAAGNRERAMAALNNLGVVASERDFAMARSYFRQALALAARSARSR